MCGGGVLQPQAIHYLILNTLYCSDQFSSQLTHFLSIAVLQVLSVCRFSTGEAVSLSHLLMPASSLSSCPMSSLHCHSKKNPCLGSPSLASFFIFHIFTEPSFWPQWLPLVCLVDKTQNPTVFLL